MPGFLLHQGAVVMCVHIGNATPVAFSPRVTVSGQPIVTMANSYAVAGCILPALTAGFLPPCATAQWTTGAVRITSMGQPVLLQDSMATCVPTGAPLFIAVTQLRVSGM